MPQELIAICGPISSGKSSLARKLHKKDGYRITPLAEPIRRMIAELISYQGTSWQEAWNWVTDTVLKETPCPYLNNQTPRFAMQTLGTEWGRTFLDANIWINAQKNHTKNEDLYPKVVIDDMRFLNEAKEIKDRGGLILALDRPGLESSPAAAHESEQNLAILFRDATIYNDGTLDDLYKDVSEKIREFQRK